MSEDDLEDRSEPEPYDGNCRVPHPRSVQIDGARALDSRDEGRVRFGESLHDLVSRELRRGPHRLGSADTSFDWWFENACEAAAE